MPPPPPPPVVLQRQRPMAGHAQPAAAAAPAPAAACMAAAPMTACIAAARAASGCHLTARTCLLMPQTAKRPGRRTQSWTRPSPGYAAGVQLAVAKSHMHRCVTTAQCPEAAMAAAARVNTFPRMTTPQCLPAAAAEEADMPRSGMTARYLAVAGAVAALLSTSAPPAAMPSPTSSPGCTASAHQSPRAGSRPAAAADAAAAQRARPALQEGRQCRPLWAPGRASRSAAAWRSCRPWRSPLKPSPRRRRWRCGSPALATWRRTPSTSMAQMLTAMMATGHPRTHRLALTAASCRTQHCAHLPAYARQASPRCWQLAVGRLLQALQAVSRQLHSALACLAMLLQWALRSRISWAAMPLLLQRWRQLLRQQPLLRKLHRTQVPLAPSGSQQMPKHPQLSPGPHLQQVQRHTAATASLPAADLLQAKPAAHRRLTARGNAPLPRAGAQGSHPEHRPRGRLAAPAPPAPPPGHPGRLPALRQTTVARAV